MNDPNKVINVNLSSLLSLKAELLRKQAEVSKAKATRVSAEEFTPNKNTIKKQDKELNKSEQKTTGILVCEYEDPALLQKSQKTLEAKSKYYERMTRSGGKMNTDENCLVLFHQKQQEQQEFEFKQPHTAAWTKENCSSDSDTDDEYDLVEYTDCLGRTRKCLQKDLEMMKKQDDELAASMPERLDQSKPNWMLDVIPNKNVDDEKSIGPDPAESILSEGCSIISKHDEMRANWEKKHEENLEKPSVHYQDVFFDEARQHGVGYYAFSTDESERAKQQKELEETRKKTVSEQEQRNKLREQREKIIAERVRAAKNRQRARLGLPPLDQSETNEAPQNGSLEKEETKEERRERKHLEKQKRKKEKLEAALELERKHHIRPWDKAKDGVSNLEEAVVPTDWHYKPERLPMSQAEWNEHKRSERNPEFAPVASASMKQPLRTNFNSATTFVPTPPTADFRNYNSSNTTKQFQRRNYQIDDSHQEEPQEGIRYSRGAAIPPPANLDSNESCLPPNSKKSKSNSELERSIEAGLRFLRNNSDKNTLSMKSTWTSKADY